jgi:hypothetical protein
MKILYVEDNGCQLFDLGGFLDLFPISGSREEAITAVR